MTTTVIRKLLWALYYKRKHTIQRLLEGGRNMRQQVQALEALKIQLQASERWGLKQHIAMVTGMQTQIALLLTVCFTKEKTFRHRILELLEECTAQYHQPTLF